MARDLKRAYNSSSGGGGMGGSCAAASVIPSMCYDLLARNGEMGSSAGNVVAVVKGGVVDDNNNGGHGHGHLLSPFSSNLKVVESRPSAATGNTARLCSAVYESGSFASIHNLRVAQQQQAQQTAAHQANHHRNGGGLTESSVLISNGSSGGSGGSETVDKGNNNKAAAPRCADDWWVESWATTTIAPPPQAAALEHNLVTSSAAPEFGGSFKPPHNSGYGNYEDFDSMLFTLPGPDPDQNVMKCLMGESQHVQHQGLQALQQQGVGGGGGQRIIQQQYNNTDAVMMESDSWSSSHHEQQQSAQSEISRLLGGTGDAAAFSVSPSPRSITAISEQPTSFLTPSFSSLPRALSLPSHMRNITINSSREHHPNSEALVRAGINGPSGGYPFTVPSPSMAATAAYSDSPESSPPAPGDLFRQPLHSNSSGFSPLQPPRESSFVAALQASMAMKEVPRSPIHGGQMPSSSNQGFHLNPPPSLVQGSFYTQDSQDFTTPHQSLQRSFSSLPALTSMDQPMKLQGIGTAHQDYLLQRQRSWQLGRSPPRHFGSDHPRNHNKVHGESRIRTGGALSPLSSSVPGFTLSSSPKLENFKSGERKEGLVNLDTGQQQEGGVIPEGGLPMKTCLLSAAKAVEVGNTEMAQAISARLNQHISPTRGKPFHRLAHYFTQALVTRIMGAENFMEQLLPDRILPPLEEYRKINAYVRFCEVSPFPRFAHFTANQAIMEAFEGENSVHVIDFRLGAGAQWASFIQDIASTQACGKSTPRVRLTAIGLNTDEMHATGASLRAFALLLNVSLEFQAVATSPELLELSMLNLRDHEAVAVNFVFSLHRLLDGTFSNRLNAVLKTVRDTQPKVITVVEQEANHSGSNFHERFSEAFQYYSFLFDSLTSSLEPGSDSSVNIENYLLAPEILNIVACEGASRVERHEQLEQWRIHLCKSGFQNRPLSDASQFQADKLVNDLSTRRGFQVARDNGCLLLCWQGRPLLAASSWTC